MAKLSDDELLSICRREEMVAQNWQDAELLAARQDAFDYYDRNVNNQAFGKEEGQSSVVTSEFADTVESVMPGLMRVFASGDQIAEFAPMEQQDEQWAKEATQYVPHVVMRENDGFRVLYWFFKDVLMYRLATATVDVDEVEKTKRETIEGWTEEQMAFREEVELERGATDVAFDVEQDEIQRQAGVAPLQVGGEPGTEPSPFGDNLGGLEQLAAPLPTFSGTVTITKKRKRVVLENVAPEDLRVSPANTRDIDQASFLGYAKEATASELRILGLSQDEIDNLPSDRRSSPEEDQRQDGQTQFSSRKDDQRRLWLVVAYVKVDMEGDGISEMWRVVYAHAGGNTPSGALVEKSKWEDGEAPITIGSAILMPHSIVGRSLFDQTQDLQDVGTAVTRGLLDNIYATNRPRPIINGRVNINTVLDWTPGMPIQMSGNDDVRANISHLQVPSIIEPALSALGYLENKRDQRTGTSRIGNNMDSDALSDASKMTKGGTSMVMSVAQERQELMANVLAATAITRLLRQVYRAIKRANAENKEPTKYFAKGEWQECHPEMWPDDMHLIVNVGTSNKQQEQMNLMGIGAAQEKIGLAQGGFNGPVVTLEHIANTGRKLAEASGYRGTSQFFSSDKDIKVELQKRAMQPPQPPPEVQAEMAKVQGAIQTEQAKTQGAIKIQAAQNEDAMRQMQAEQQIQTEKAQQEAQIKAMELQAKQQEQALQAQLKAEEIQIKREELALKRLELEHKREEMAVSTASAARDQEHERQTTAQTQHHERLMARAKTTQGEVDGMTETPDAGEGLTQTLRDSVAAQREGVAVMQQSMEKSAATMEKATTIMAQTITKLADMHDMETEVTTSTGKTLRARKVPRSK